MQQKKLTACNFCQHAAHGHCNAPRENSIYCREAKNEFYAYLAKNKKDPRK